MSDMDLLAWIHGSTDMDSSAWIHGSKLKNSYILDLKLKNKKNKIIAVCDIYLAYYLIVHADNVMIALTLHAERSQSATCCQHHSVAFVYGISRISA